MNPRLSFAAALAVVALAPPAARADETAAAEETPRPPVIQQVMPAPYIPPIRVPTPVALTALASDTFVAVKDNNESQTVMVYKVTPDGRVRLTDRKEFFYKASK